MDDGEEPVEDEARGCVLEENVWAVVAVYPDGDEVWWVFDERDDADPGQGCACAKCAPHDHLGPGPGPSCGLGLTLEPSENEDE